jgi:hypothetical protein
MRASASHSTVIELRERIARLEGRSRRAKSVLPPDPRGLPPRSFKGRTLTDPYGHIRQIAVKGRNFR